MITQIGLIFGTLCAFLVMANAVDNQQFSQNLFNALVTDASQKNVIYSPISIQSCLAMAFVGSKGDTAEELRSGLMLGSSDTKTVANEYGNFLSKSFANQKDNGPQLKLANRIYVNEGLKIQPAVRNVLETNFQSGIETVTFGNSAAAVGAINAWVEQSTNGQIRDLMPVGSTSDDTSAVLVNAIYFKGKWAKPFSKEATSYAEFAVNAERKVPVQMMFADERLKYAELPELDATAVELPYEHSDLSMLIILPNKVDGLQQVEQKLANMNLFSAIDTKFNVEDVEIFLPKFKIEFEADLKPTMQKLGITKIFSNNADLSGLFAESTVAQKISDIRHKAFLDVNEAGTEAAAATFLKIVPMMLNLGTKTFRVDHPFIFAIRSKNAIYYAGHVVNI